MAHWLTDRACRWSNRYRRGGRSCWPWPRQRYCCGDGPLALPPGRSGAPLVLAPAQDGPRLVDSDEPFLAVTLPTCGKWMPPRPVGAPERTSLVQITDCQ
jgi:hypothetical protein